MERESHLGEAAELYATGHLDAAGRASVEWHIAGCDECRRRVGEAEETVLALEREVTPEPLPLRYGRVLPSQRHGIPVWWLVPAAAAAFILGLLLSHVQSQRDPATLAMIGSHFSHAQFNGAPGLAAKVIYARDRSWYYVIVAGNHRYTVYGIADNLQSALGYTETRGGTSTFFTRVAARFDRIELRDGPRIVGTATIR